MAFGNRCVNCGYLQEDHDRNLVNMPVSSDFEWLEEIQKGYRMDILTCMETRWTRKYSKHVENMQWGFDLDCGWGYVSSCPEKEVEEYDRQPPYCLPTSIMWFYDPSMPVIQME